MSAIKKQILKRFCDQTDLSPVFIERLAELYNGLEGNERGLTPEEWQEYAGTEMPAIATAVLAKYNRS